MATLHRSVATLLVQGDELDPTKVTELLGAPATRSWRKGEDIRMRPELPPRYGRQGHWRREATPTQPANLDSQVLELLGILSGDVHVWQQLCAKFKVSLFCGWFMAEGNEGVEIAPSTLVLLGERGISLDLDMYAPDHG